MTVLPPLIVASKAISEPLELFSLSVISASTLESSSAESLVSLTASLKVSVMFESTATEVALSKGLKVVVGAALSTAVKVTLAALIALLEASSTLVPIAT